MDGSTDRQLAEEYIASLPAVAQAWMREFKIPYSDAASKQPLREFVDSVMARHSVPKV